MTIAFNCAGCDNLFKVPDSLAGRRGKCPKCGKVNLVPPAGQIQAASPPPRTAARKAKIVEPEVLDPEVVEEEEEETAPRPRKRARKPAEEDDFGVEELDEVEEEEEEERPRRKRKKQKKIKRRSPLLLVGIIGGAFALLLLCAGGGGLAWWWFFSSTDEMKFLPAGSQIVLSARVDQFLQSDVWKELKREVPEVEGQGLKKLDEGLGLTTSNIDRILVGGSVKSNKDGIVIIRTKQSVKASEILAAMKNSNHKETKVGKYTMHERQGTADLPSFCVVESKLVVYGEKESLREVLTRDKKPEFAGTMKDALKQADFSKSLVLVLDIQAMKSSQGGGGGPLPLPLGQNNELMQSLEKANGLVVQTKVGSDVRLDVTLLCRDAGAANDIKKLVDAALVMGKNEKSLPQAIKDLMNINLKVDGSNVTASTSFKVAPLIQTYKKQKGPF